MLRWNPSAKPGSAFLLVDLYLLPCHFLWLDPWQSLSCEIFLLARSSTPWYDLGR